MDDVGDGLITEIVCLAVDRSLSDSTSGQPSAKAIRIVVPTDTLFVLNDGQTSHLPTPMDQRRIEQSSALEILDQSRRRLIGFLASSWQSVFDIAVVVPLLGRCIDLDETDSAFDEPSGDQASGSVLPGGVLIQPIHLMGLFGFLADIQSIAGCGLHRFGEFITGHASLQVVFVGSRRQVLGVEFLEQIQIGSLRPT